MATVRDDSGLERLPTETWDPAGANLDLRSTAELVDVMNEADAEVPRAVARARDTLAAAIDAIAARLDGADVAGDADDAFRSFRATLRPGERFALAFGPDMSVSDRGMYRLLALSYLYPAIVANDPEHAQAVMVFGPPSAEVRSIFDETGVVDGVWLGHRP